MAAYAPFITCLAVLGKQPRHNPLFIRVFGERDPLPFHYYIHCAIDIIEERITNAAVPNAPQFDKYMGLLCPIDDYKIFCYLTISDVKFIVIIQDVAVRDADIKSWFRWLHGLYVDTMMNPFFVLDYPIESKRFSAEVDKVVGSFESILKTRVDSLQSP